MRLSIIPKAQLSPPELHEATLRIFAPEHACDVGPRNFWNRREHDQHHFALFDRESGEFVGTVYCIVRSPVAQDFTWWIDSRCRMKGYGHALADDLAAYLKSKRAVEKIGFIVFGRTHAAASQKIAQRLRDHFDTKVDKGHREAKEQRIANSPLVSVKGERPPQAETVVITNVQLDGQSRPADRGDDAVLRYRQEADGGNATAQFILGGMYAQGLHGLPRDEAEAVKWYQLAARQGSEYARAALRRLGASW